MALTLTRRHDESIMIGEDIQVTVREIRGGQVKLVIDAPSSIPIFRTEIWRERRRAQIPRDSTQRRRVVGAEG